MAVPARRPEALRLGPLDALGAGGLHVAPFLANTFGWLFTEMGRQPWIVYGLMRTGRVISPSVSTTDVALTLGGFVLLYTVLGVIDVVLMVRAARRGLGPDDERRRRRASRASRASRRPRNSSTEERQ